MSKKRKGHYCLVCDTILSDELFSGKSNKQHLCEKCSKLPARKRNFKIAEKKLSRLYGYKRLSHKNLIMLERCRKNKNPLISEFADKVYNDFFNRDYTEYYEEYELFWGEQEKETDEISNNFFNRDDIEYDEEYELFLEEKEKGIVEEEDGVEEEREIFCDNDFPF